MAGGYESRPDGAEFFTREFRDIWAAIRAISGANKLTSAVIDKGDLTVQGGGNVRVIDDGGVEVSGGGSVAVTGGGNIEVSGGGGVDLRDSGIVRMYDTSGTYVGSMYVGGLDLIDPATGGAMSMRQGNIQLWDDYGGVGSPGRITVDQGRGINFLRILPPYSSGTGLENSVSVRGRTPTSAGKVFVFSDGGVQIVAPELALFDLPTTSSASNMFLGAAGASTWSVARVTSSRRYKADEADAVIDPAEVLSLSGRTWVDVSLMDNGPAGDVSRNVGFIAEELDERPSLRQFVDYDDQGRPDAIQYDRLSVALLEVAKDQQARLDRMEERLTALEAK